MCNEPAAELVHPAWGLSSHDAVTAVTPKRMRARNTCRGKKRAERHPVRQVGDCLAAGVTVGHRTLRIWPNYRSVTPRLGRLREQMGLSVEYSVRRLLLCQASFMCHRQITKIAAPLCGAYALRESDFAFPRRLCDLKFTEDIQCLHLCSKFIIGYLNGDRVSNTRRTFSLFQDHHMDVTRDKVDQA